MVQNNNNGYFAAITAGFLVSVILFSFLVSMADQTGNILLGTNSASSESLDMVGLKGDDDLIQGLGLTPQVSGSNENDSTEGLSAWKSKLGLDKDFSQLSDDDSDFSDTASINGISSGSDGSWHSAAAAVNHFIDLNSSPLEPVPTHQVSLGSAGSDFPKHTSSGQLPITANIS